MQLLHIDSSVLGGNSASRVLSAEIAARQAALYPGLKVTHRDLAADAVLHLSPAHMAAWQGGLVEDASLGADLAKGGAYLEELLGADIPSAQPMRSAYLTLIVGSTRRSGFMRCSPLAARSSCP